MNKLKFGAKVIVSAILKRKEKEEVREKGLYKYKVALKFWEKNTAAFKALYIGERTLCNGKIDWENDVGYIFTPENYFRAALVVKDERSKPVLCPIESVEEDL